MDRHRATERRREKGTRRQGDKGTGRHGDKETRRFDFLVSSSPTFLVPLSPCLPLGGISMKATAFTLLLISFLFLSSSAKSQRLTPRSEFSLKNRLHRNLQGKAEFTFTRLRYEGIGWRESWTTDYPKADFQFVIGLRHWCRSRLDIAAGPTHPGSQATD